MLSEHVKKDAVVKLYPSSLEAEGAAGEENSLLGRGRMRNIVSESEIEIILEEDAKKEFQKNICYLMYIFSAQEVFLCSCYFKLSYLEKESRVLQLEVVSPLERVQCRMHQRVSCHSKIQYEVVPPEDLKKHLEEENAGFGPDLASSRDSIVDISGGGIRFTTKKPIAVNDFLFVRFEIMEKKQPVEIKSMGQVVYSGVLRNEEKCYDIRMKFIGLSEETRRRIIFFVFQLERDSINVRWQHGGGFA
jgi:hypothetical protein